MAKTQPMPSTAYSTPPIAEPMTRERFICTDCSDTAPGRSSRGTSVGRIAPIAGAFSALKMPMTSTHRKIQRQVRRVDDRERDEQEREHHLHRLHRDEEAPPVHLVGDHAADLAQEEQRAELGEVDEADVAGVVVADLVARTRRG